MSAAREQTKPGDPEFKVYENVAKWHNTILCLPSWQEALEYEYIRQSGKFNMITELNAVKCYAYDTGMYSCVSWIQRCKDARVSPWGSYERAMPEHEKEHGPRETWVSKDMKMKFDERELEAEERKLNEQLLELKRKQRALKKKAR
jgi:hypothetical protein